MFPTFKNLIAEELVDVFKVETDFDDEDGGADGMTYKNPTAAEIATLRKESIDRRLLELGVWMALDGMYVWDRNKGTHSYVAQQMDRRTESLGDALYVSIYWNDKKILVRAARYTNKLTRIETRNYMEQIEEMPGFAAMKDWEWKFDAGD